VEFSVKRCGGERSGGTPRGPRGQICIGLFLASSLFGGLAFESRCRTERKRGRGERERRDRGGEIERGSERKE
jgi:hypothetical protein